MLDAENSLNAGEHPANALGRSASVWGFGGLLVGTVLAASVTGTASERVPTNLSLRKLTQLAVSTCHALFSLFAGLYVVSELWVSGWEVSTGGFGVMPCCSCSCTYSGGGGEGTGCRRCGNPISSTLPSRTPMLTSCILRTPDRTVAESRDDRCA